MNQYYILLLFMIVVLMYKMYTMYKTKTNPSAIKNTVIEYIINEPNNIIKTDSNTTDSNSFMDIPEKEIDIVDIKNVISGKSPESVYDKSINYKSVIAGKGTCGRPEKELLKAATSLDSLLNCEFEQLDTNTRVNYLYYKYFKGDDEEKQQYFDSVKQKKDDDFIENLPYGDDCKDKKADCKKWANAGECVTNPGSMLYDCAKSCRACALSEDDKTKITQIIKSKDPYSCTYHEY